MSTLLRTTLVLLTTIVMGCAAENGADEDPVDPGAESSNAADSDDESSATGAEQALSVPCSIEVLPPRGNLGYAGAMDAQAKVRCYSSTRFTYRVCIQQYRLGGGYATVECDAYRTVSLDLYRGTQWFTSYALAMESGTYRTRLTINGTHYYSRSAWCNTYI